MTADRPADQSPSPPAPRPATTAASLRDARLEDRSRTIAFIRGFNPTASEAFLATFRTSDLKDYLGHLRHARHKHVRLAGWLEQRVQRRCAGRDAA